MQEYLNKATGEYRKTTEKVTGEQWIEVPAGAEAARNVSGGVEFYKNDLSLFFNIEGKKWERTVSTRECLLRNIIWQRPTQPEALPFIDDEPKGIEKEAKAWIARPVGRCRMAAINESLNDQYAEIEQVRQQTIEATLAERQSTYGSFEDVAFVTENIMSVLGRVRANGLSELPNTHRMALYMIASKMARIVNGDFNHIDGWHDIGGYAKLVEDLIKENNNEY